MHMKKFDLSQAIRHKIKANDTFPYRGEVRELEVIDEMLANVTTPTAYADLMLRRYDVSVPELAKLSPALAIRTYHGNQAIERNIEADRISYVDFKKSTLTPLHNYDLVVGNATALIYLKYALKATPNDLNKAISEGSVGEFLFAGDFTKGYSKNSRGLTRTRIYLLTELNTITPEVTVEETNEVVEEKKVEKIGKNLGKKSSPRGFLF
jgi:hypothetical protein